MNHHSLEQSGRQAAAFGGISERNWVQALQYLDNADSLVITAGAGMGVDSGLPDFRGDEGLWRAYPALRTAGLNFVNVASPRTFRRDPQLAWGFYGHRLNLYRNTRPHDGFHILKRWAERMKQGGFVYTSNVDGQFQKAGFPEEGVVECHGSLHWLQCMDMCDGRVWEADDWRPDVDEAACRLLSPLPRCPSCGSLARPNVLMFNDSDWQHERTERQQQRLEEWLQGVSRPVVVELGAGTAVPAVRWFGSVLGVPLIRINLRESEMESATGVGLAGPAMPVLLELERRWSGART